MADPRLAPEPAAAPGPAGPDAEAGVRAADSTPGRDDGPEESPAKMAPGRLGPRVPHRARRALAVLGAAVVVVVALVVAQRAVDDGGEDPAVITADAAFTEAPPVQAGRGLAVGTGIDQVANEEGPVVAQEVAQAKLDRAAEVDAAVEAMSSAGEDDRE